MASYTANYGLHQWEAADDFLRTDFNADHQLIDAALAGLEAGKAEVVIGSYIGDGEAQQIISLGFTPLAVLVENQQGQRGDSQFYRYTGLLLPGQTYPMGGVVEGGFVMYYSYQQTQRIFGNSLNMPYCYLAFRPTA